MAHRHLPLLSLLLTAPALASAAQLPDGYVEEEVLTGVVGLVGITHDAGGRMFVWSRSGKVWLVEGDSLVQPPLLDLSEEVGAWRDFGLLGFALDPEFLQNGLLYTYYVVDRHHLLHHGTPAYDPDANEYFEATIGRVTRFTADPSTGFSTVLDGSRLVLLGESPSSGIPILHQSHGTGSLAFGSDGTLLLSSGDGASYDSVDSGSSPGSYWSQALADGIIRLQDNVGAFRAQLIGSLSGKVLRIDPATGDGSPSNPWFDPAQPRSPRSRVWTLGLRNPYSFTVRPGTGSADPAAGSPGTLYLGDVGWADGEELNVIGEPGMNLGWPLFEGLSKQGQYSQTPTPNLDAPNPLYDAATCTQEFFLFQDLIKQEREDHDPDFANPCDMSVDIAPSTPTFMHRRAAIEWRHQGPLAFVPTFEGGKARRSKLGDPSCPVHGEPFGGECSIGGVWLSGLGFGAPFKGLYFHADYASSWIRAFEFEADDHLHEVFEFSGSWMPVCLAEDPTDGSLLYVQLPSNSVRRIRYIGDGNVAPQAQILVDTPHGPSPRLVRLDGSGSFDPEDGDLTFLWEFEDGSTSSEPSPLILFDNPAGTPGHQEVELTVTDPSGSTGHAHAHIHLDNTPPVVEIQGPVNGSHYPSDSTTLLSLDAVATDAEHLPASLSYEWQLFLHHGSHNHPEEQVTGQQAQFLLTPTPCTSEFYGYRVVLTVTDPEGASASRSLWLLPDCPWNGSASITTPTTQDVIDPSDLVQVEVQATGAVDRVDLLCDGVLLGSSFAPPYHFEWTPTSPGEHLLSALAQVAGEGAVTSTGVAIQVRKPVQVRSQVLRVRDDAAESLYDGGVVRGRGRLNLGLGGAEPFLVGIRVPLQVPSGAKIVSAHLEFSASAPDPGLAQLSLTAEHSVDASPITKTNRGLSGRGQTATSVTWKPEPWRYTGARGARQQTPDLKVLLEELLEQPGWQAGGHVLLLVEGFGQRRARSFLGAGTDAPTLVVNFQP